MLCQNCSKLLILASKRVCVQCKGDVYQNISVLCESCSTKNKVCSVCLKKIYSLFDNPKRQGCKGCGTK